ncbi:endonuclease III [Sulfobacillus harzensis]|uniref:Endonuclease III n=1 Tax=Sulfobacillus harzensis TaxID=2729629 RepID=A0A7Y0L3L2_9FIRM|nr:endonuclease III [Sulfobacillus harzensis]NMP22076.1 endonuclease III [Sulfobacillus harzensis]
MRKAHVARVLAQLEQLYPDASTELNFTTPFELLVATMLSAQCTDRRVNLITPRLFARCPDAFHMAEATVAEIESLIQDCNLFHTKARNLAQTARLLVDRWSGEVPADRDQLMTLPGVGRKTANVVLANAFGQDALAVDTHVFRVAHRLGWATAKDAEGTEQQLTKLLPKKTWSRAHHWLILHGRRVCIARRPQCAICPLSALCPKVGVINLEAPIS